MFREYSIANRKSQIANGPLPHWNLQRKEHRKAREHLQHLFVGFLGLLPKQLFSPKEYFGTSQTSHLLHSTPSFLFLSAFQKAFLCLCGTAPSCRGSRDARARYW